jgi:hypothetical protein
MWYRFHSLGKLTINKNKGMPDFQRLTAITVENSFSERVETFKTLSQKLSEKNKKVNFSTPFILVDYS